MALPITGSSQSQTTTQSPQAGAQSINTGGQSSSLQPNVTNGLNSGPGSVTLHPTDLTTLNLNGTSKPTTSTATVTKPVVKPHHANAIFLGVAIVLIIAAVILVMTTGASRKNALLKNK